MEQIVVWHNIAPSEFLRIFVVSTLVLVFGVGYAGTITLSKMQYFSKKWQILGYIFWALQTYCLYDMSILIQSSHFTTKVLMVTMIVYLFVPHLYFYLIDESEKRYEKNGHPH